MYLLKVDLYNKVWVELPAVELSVFAL